jgi:cyclophilin family peptidyl-prolyl cis-trans isomerase
MISNIKLLLVTILVCSCIGSNTDQSKLLITSPSQARLKTIHGDIVFTFKEHHAPLTSERIKTLISNGFYNGLEFHRVIPNYIVQSGDPIGNGTGGSGHLLKAETNLLEHKAGMVSMARNESDLNSADSQFFFTLQDQPELDGKYTIFAEVYSGLDVLKKIKEGDKIILLILE